MAFAADVRTISGDLYNVWRPVGWKADGTRRGVIYCHGGGGGYYGWWDLMHRLCEELGTIVVSPDLVDASLPVPGATWGNDVSMTKMGAAKTALAGLGCRSDKVFLTGASMGTITALNWLRENPTLVAGITGNVGAIDADDIHDNDRASQQANIRNAYGGLAGWNAAEPTKNPIKQMTAINATGVPILLESDTTDPFCLPALTTAFGQGVTKCQVIERTGPGHFATTLLTSTYVNFYRSLNA